jgi:hypothetical protein
MTYFTVVTHVTLIQPWQPFSFSLRHPRPSGQVPGECPCWAKPGLDACTHCHFLDLELPTLPEAGLSPPTRDVGRIFAFPMVRGRK